MIKRRGENQIENLTPDHRSLESRGSNEVRFKHVIHCWKGILKNYKILSLHFQNKVDLKQYEHPKS
jgi:hypothetical protein